MPYTTYLQLQSGGLGLLAMQRANFPMFMRSLLTTPLTQPIPNSPNTGLAGEAAATREQQQQHFEQQQVHQARLQAMQAADPKFVMPTMPKTVLAPKIEGPVLVAAAGTAGGVDDLVMEASYVPQWGGPFLR